MKRTVILAILLLSLSILAACTAGISGDASAEKGLELYNEGKLTEAIEEFNKAIETGSSIYEMSDLYKALGNCYLDLDKYDEAIETYKKAVDEDDSSASAWVNLGVAYRQNGDLDGAEECYSKALEIDPEYAELHSSLGTLYIIKNEPEKAIEEFEKAIELDRSLAVTFGNAALAYAMTGDFEKADELLKQSIVLGYENAQEIQKRIDMLQ